MRVDLQELWLARPVTRRSVLGGVAGALAAASGLARVGAQEATPAQADGAWAFTDDKGVTVTLPSRPLRIAADVNAAAPLWDFGIRPIAVFGWNATETGDFGDAGGNVDPAAVEVIGDATERIKLEDLAALQPDLVVTVTWEPADPTEYWSIDVEVIDQVRAIAPIVAISAKGVADANMERFAQLSEALGADPQTPALAAAKEAYDAALVDVEAVVEGKSDVTVLFLYADAGQLLYIASPQDWADLSFYKNLGLQMVQPALEPLVYWEELSLEQALKYPADVIFNSSRPGTLTMEEIAAHVTLGQHPAVKAGQVAPWNQDFIMSYQGMAAALTSIADGIRNARMVI